MADSDDWGLLSVADFIGASIEGRPKEKSETAWIMNDMTFSIYCGNSPQLANLFTTHLSTRVKAEQNSRSSEIEELYQNRSRKLQHSLSTSKQIRERLSATTDFLTSSVPEHSSRITGFETISLLGSSLRHSDPQSYVDLFLDSIAHIDWKAASSQSCYEVLTSLHNHLDDSNCSVEKQTLLRKWKMTLSIASGSLCEITRCLLLPDSQLKLEEQYIPPPSRFKVDLVESSINSFFIRRFSFPSSIDPFKVFCVPRGDNLMVCCGSSLSSVESLGMMGTRLQKRTEQNLCLESGESFLTSTSDCALVTKVVRIEDLQITQLFREIELNGGKEKRRGTLIINCEGFELRSYHVTFAVLRDNLACLINCFPSAAPHRKLLISDCISLEELFSAQKNTKVRMTAQKHSLLRNPVLIKDQTALHFLKGKSLFVGKVSLKDHFSPFCVEAWVYPRNAMEAQTVISIGKKRVEEIVIEFEPTSDGIEWRAGSRTPYLSASLTRYNCPGKSSFCERWWHVALNFTGSSWELWLDNRFVSHAPALVSPEPILNALVNLGKSFVGFLAEVRIWSSTRTATELHRDSHRRLSEFDSGLMAYFPLNEGSGDLITDHAAGAQHTLLDHHAAAWSNVSYLPVLTQEAEKLISDFIPTADSDDHHTMFFAMTQHYFSLATVSDKQAITIFQYGSTDRILVSQIRIDLKGEYRLRGITYNPSKGSLLCWASSKENTSQLTLWDVHNQGFVPFSGQRVYSSIWECGCDFFAHAAKYARKFINSERYLADQSTWTPALPDFAVDYREDLIPFLVALIRKANEVNDTEFAQHACLLLHVNLFFRCELNKVTLLSSLGGQYSSVAELLDASSRPVAQSNRDNIIQIALMPFTENTYLLRMCCQCFLTHRSMIFFLNGVAGKSHRSSGEEKLFLCLLDFYSTLQACNEILNEKDQAQILYCALIREAAFQVDRCDTERGSLVLRSTSRSMEVFQELLFAKVTEDSNISMDLSQLAIHYSITLLRACEKTVEAVRKALRRCPQAEVPLMECLEHSHVGSLLPAFSLSLPVLPIAVLSSCSQRVQECRETLSALMSSVTIKSKWVSDLGIALTFSLSLIGCSLLQADFSDASPIEMDPRFLRLLYGGLQKADSERTILIKNLQQGVGSISKTFEEMQKKDYTALRVVRDESLKRMERNAMAAFCSLTVSTQDLVESSVESLAPAFRYVLQMRPWILSKRQESKEFVSQVEERAIYLSQFEAICRSPSEPSGLSRSTKPTKEVASHRKWRRLFRAWKATRLQKTLQSTQESGDHSALSNTIVEFLQSDINPRVPEAIIAQRTQKAQYRLSGLLLLKQLVDEARVNEVLSVIVLPALAKALCGWHYSDGVDCCSSEHIFRLHGAYFQLFDAVLSKYQETAAAHPNPWAALLCSLFTAEMRSLDFQHIKPEVCSVFRSLWMMQDGKRSFSREPNQTLPASVRGTKLSTDAAAQSMIISESGVMVKSHGGRGTCVAPCSWRSSVKAFYYFEVYVIDMLSGSSCSIGVGPSDYSLSRLPGWDPPSYALQSDEGLWSSRGKIAGLTFGVGDVIGCGWNLETKEIYWTKNGTLLVSTEVSQEELNPLIGFEGSGAAKVNFGTEVFAYRSVALPPSVPTEELNIRNQSWDAFRMFSIRAAMCLSRSTANHLESEAVDRLTLARPVHYCFKALSEEISDALEGGGPTAILTSVVYQVTTLAQLLESVPKDITTKCVEDLVQVLEKVTAPFLSSPLASLEFLLGLLTAWFHVMNLSPPPPTVDDPSTSILIRAPTGFLSTLVRLAGRLFCVPGDSVDQSPYFNVLACLRVGAEDLSNMALSLLQRVNGSTPFTSAAKGHSWSCALHEWIVATLQSSGPVFSTELMTALATLGGSCRHAAPGDIISVHHSTCVTEKARLISYSLTEEVCDVVDDEGKCKTLPLRLCCLIAANDETNYFPIPSCSNHGVQCNEVLSFSLRVLQRPSSATSANIDESNSAAICHPQLLSILWRASRRSVIQLPASFLRVLFSFSEESVDDQTPPPADVNLLRGEKVMTEWLCTAALQSAYDHNLLDAMKIGMNAGDDALAAKVAARFAAGQRDLNMSLTTTSSSTSFNDGLQDEVIDVGHFSPNQRTLLLTNPEDEDVQRFLNDDMGLAHLDEEEEDDEDDEEERNDEEDYIERYRSEDGNEEDESMELSGLRRTVQVCFDESSECIQFEEKSYLCLWPSSSVGTEYTIDLSIRPHNTQQYQIIFTQVLTEPTTQLSLELIGRINENRMEFGVVECGDEKSGKQPRDEWLCRTSLTHDNPHQFLRFTFVQLGSTISLYSEGILQETKKIPFTGSLLQHELRVGGDAKGSTFTGYLRGFRVYVNALDPTIVDQLHALVGSMATMTNACMCLLLRAKHHQRFFNGCTSPSTIDISIATYGTVSIVDHSSHSKTDNRFCLHELDYSGDAEEKDIFTVGALQAVGDSFSTAAIWRRRDITTSPMMLNTRRRLGKLFAEFYSICILSDALLRRDLKDDSDDSVIQSVMACDGVKRVICYTVMSGNASLLSLLSEKLQQAALSLHECRPSLTGVVSDSIKHLLRLGQREEKVQKYESSHPYPPSTRSTYDVSIAGQACYQVFFDARCAASDTSFIFASDQGMCNELLLVPGFALVPFMTPLPRMFFNVRNESEEPQWGYKVFVVYEFRPQLLAMRILRSMVYSFLKHASNPSLLPYLTSGECFISLARCVQVNTGKTRRLAISCLTDLSLHAESLPLASRSPFAFIFEIRRMTEKRFKKYLPNQMVHSRFLQVASECYLTYRDAYFCWQRPRGLPPNEKEEHSQSREEFAAQRLEQQTLYNEREGEDRVKLYRLQEPHNIEVEASSERTFTVTGGRVVAATPLTRGSWYYELRVGRASSMYVGVIPVRGKRGVVHSESILHRLLPPIAYNGKGEQFGGDGRLAGVTSPVWHSKDFIGVVLNVTAKTVTVLVNGEDRGIQFSFDDRVENLNDCMFCPFFAMDPQETVLLNLGGRHFEFDPPRFSLPLDATYLTLSPLIPYNQIRAFQDLSTHLLTDGSHPMPPFCFDESDPFAGSTERTGPAHVSLHPVDGVQVNGLDVKNVGNSFSTVLADCTVSGGSWYFEVTLRSQGLMQIGWAVKSELKAGSVGDMPSSWSLDLFRQVKWFNGKCEPVSVPRRWNVGDVIGCSIDLQTREINFYFHGRRISGGSATFRSIPVGVQYVPGISMRAGNHVTFNFGSTAFKYKPDNCQALGVPDSWCERMDTYYNNESASATLRRHRAMCELWRRDPLSMSGKWLTAMQEIVKAVDSFCQETGKNYSQITLPVLHIYLQKQGWGSGLIQDSWDQFNVLCSLTRVCLVSIPFLCINTTHVTATTALFLQIRTILFRQVRAGHVISMLRETNNRVEQIRLSVNRRRARQQPLRTQNTIFGQTLRLLVDRHPRAFHTNKRMWTTVFLGEGADDVGGPYREHLNEICCELMSTSLPFFVPTANHSLNTGTHREAFVPAAGATSAYDCAAFTLVGRLMGYAMRSDEPLGLFFPPIVWKYLCRYPIEESDIHHFDSICLQCIVELRTFCEKNVSSDDFADVFDEEFVTRLSDNSIKELIPGGANVKVTLERCKEYAGLMLAARLHEFDLQLNQIREGLLSVVPEVCVLLFTPTELEQKICGKSDYRVEELKKGAIYDGLTAEDRRVMLLWQALEDATPLQRRLFLRFVSGRERLPVKLRVLPLSSQGEADDKLPQAATCFFAIELPDYSSLEVMKQKLYFSIENCADMDKDFNARAVDEEEGPRLVIQQEDGQEDGTATQEE